MSLLARELTPRLADLCQQCLLLLRKTSGRLTSGKRLLGLLTCQLSPRLTNLSQERLLTEVARCLACSECLLGFLTSKLASRLADLSQKGLLLLSKVASRLTCSKSILSLLGRHAACCLAELAEQCLTLACRGQGLTISGVEHLSDLAVEILLGLSLNLAQHLGATLRTILPRTNSSSCGSRRQVLAYVALGDVRQRLHSLLLERAHELSSQIGRRACGRGLQVWRRSASNIRPCTLLQISPSSTHAALSSCSLQERISSTSEADVRASGEHWLCCAQTSSCGRLLQQRVSCTSDADVCASSEHALSRAQSAACSSLLQEWISSAGDVSARPTSQQALSGAETTTSSCLLNERSSSTDQIGASPSLDVGTCCTCAAPGSSLLKVRRCRT